jgi:Secretion system C-terminal sorting domain
MLVIRLILLGSILLSSEYLFSQTCPVFDKRNNGLSGNCHPGDSPQPSGYNVRSGGFQFTSGPGFNMNVDSIYIDGSLYQKGLNAPVGGNIWFGNYLHNGGTGSTSQICFYAADQNQNAPPAGRWKFYFSQTSNTANKLVCVMTIASGGTSGYISDPFDPGSISAGQSICPGSSPGTISNTSSASGCGSTPTYQWQVSANGVSFTNIAGANSIDLSVGSLTQTTFYRRMGTCGAVTAATDVSVITVISAGTISPSAGYTWDASTTSPTFTITGATSGGTGTWSSSNTGVATIGSSSGVLSAVSAGTSIITYSLFAGGITCTTTRNITITGTPGALPVTWQAVVAEKLSDRVLVRWTTAAELNTRDFEVQFSTNATDWHPVGTVPAAGKSESPRDYSFLHQSPQKGGVHNFYRILQRDLDGTSSYSKIVSIIMDAPGPDVMIFPNPASHILTLYLAESQLLRLVNTSGATVWQAKLPAGRHQLPVTHLSKGVYLMLTNQGTKRVVIQ